MRQLQARRGQGSLEYIIILVVILLAILAGAPLIKEGVKDSSMKNAELQMQHAASKFVVK